MPFDPLRSQSAIRGLVRLARVVCDHTSSDEDAMQHLADALAEHAGGDGVAVFRVTSDGLLLAAFRGLPEGLHAWKVEVDDISSELGRVLLDAIGRGIFKDAKTLPMVSAGGLFGAAVLFRRREDDGTEPWNDEVAQGLVDLAAIGLATSAQLQSILRVNEELRASRAALAHGEKLRALGQMAAGISHDLKNILNPLSLHIQIAARGNARGNVQQVDETLREMKHALARGLDVIERLRDFSRQAPDSKAVPVDLNALARETVQLARPRMVSASGRVNSVQEDLGHPPPILGQPSEIVSALLNLLANGVEAAPDGVHITVRTGEESGGAWVAVADDGPGMSAEVQARVFEPFFTTKGTEGTGLGLAMVYATMHRHRGKVRLDTAPGKGATFTLWFPPLPPRS
ncbi:MAG: HAMP domain-containing sensor histidine kinase [Polyangiaceae bacterium]